MRDTVYFTLPPKQQRHSREMKKQSCYLFGGFYIIRKTDKRHQSQCQHKPRVLKTTRQKISQCTEVEDNSPTP